LSWDCEMGRVEHIHFVGIGGVGMAGIAEVLLSLGYQVSGSDLNNNALTQHLASLGATIYCGHDAKYILGADVIVRSSAVDLDNPELAAARLARMPVVQRAEMLGELMRFRYGIAIAGTHGKTTTTSLITTILAYANLDPTFVIGGRLNSAGSNAKLGTGHYLVAEADESDASFLYLQPRIVVVTNIDADHMSTYNNDFAQLCTAFVSFIQNLPFYGIAVLCLDDPVIRSILPLISRPILTYGFAEDADFRVLDMVQTGAMTAFNLQRPGDDAPLNMQLNLPGRHNVLNATAAIAVATELAIATNDVQAALQKFAGIGRRFQIYGDFRLQNQGLITLVDDYGHHPREIAATLEAVRKSWPAQRLVMVYQPHRYTRTRDLFEDFCAVLAKVDVLILLDVYAAGEEVILGADSQALIDKIHLLKDIKLIYVQQHDRLAQTLQNVLLDHDVLLMQGAGNIGAISAQLAATNLCESIAGCNYLEAG
jgi:UDP-N-acetylmuramate--alanine ligase